MPFAWETSTRLPPHTSQKTAVTVPSSAATTGVPSGAEMSVPLWSSYCPVSGAVRHPNSPPFRTVTGWAGAISVLTGSFPSNVAGAWVEGARDETPLTPPVEPVEDAGEDAAPPSAFGAALPATENDAGTTLDSSIAAWSATEANRDARTGCAAASSPAPPGSPEVPTCCGPCASCAMAGCQGAVTVPLLTATLTATSSEKEVKAVSAIEGFLTAEERARERAISVIESPGRNPGAVSPRAGGQWRQSRRGPGLYVVASTDDISCQYLPDQSSSTSPRT